MEWEISLMNWFYQQRVSSVKISFCHSSLRILSSIRPRYLDTYCSALLYEWPLIEVNQEVVITAQSYSRDSILIPPSRYTHTHTHTHTRTNRMVYNDQIGAVIPSQVWPKERNCHSYSDNSTDPRLALTCLMYPAPISSVKTELLVFAIFEEKIF